MEVVQIVFDCSSTFEDENQREGFFMKNDLLTARLGQLPLYNNGIQLDHKPSDTPR